MEQEGSPNYRKWENGPNEVNVNGDKAGEKDSNEPITFTQSAKNMAFTGPLNLLLGLVPFALISYYADWPDAATFVLSLLALAPLAERLGYVTEQLSLHTNETIGGLLNATFGNATELIVAISALSRGLYRLVQLSLLGSILSNMLLVLGCAFFFGGIYHKTQTYGTISSQINSTLLLLSTMAVLFPTILTNSGQESNLGELGLSRAVSFVLLAMYAAFIYFQVS
jgi:Ca2+:H+ antiporter